MPRRRKYTVSVVNPSRRRAKKRSSKKRAKKRTKTRAKKRTTKRNTAKPKRRTTTMARRRKTTRRRSTTRRAAPRRRRRTTTATRRRRRTRSNPRSRGRGRYLGGFALDPMGPWDGMLPRLAGKVFSVWAVKRWGDQPGSPNSPTTGGAWTFKNYLFSMLAGYLGGELVSRMMDKKAGEQFYQGSADFTATKLMWSEMVMRWGWSANALGSAYPSFAGGAYPSFGNVEVRQLMEQGMPGDIIDDGQGNRLLNKGGRWVAMMGADMGADIVEAGPLGEVIEAGPLGTVIEAGPLGHMMPASATAADDAQGSYMFRGSKSPYTAAYT